MFAFQKIFNRSHSVIIGMIHLRALPGSPSAKLTMEEICDIACKEASIYSKSGLDGIMIENMHDVPWCRADQLGPETVAAMSVACSAVRKQVPDLPMGVQVLSGGNRQALAIAKATGLNFIRAEGFVFSHIGDEGPMDSCAADILRYRRALHAEDVLVFTDIKKKHSSHAITSDVSLNETAQAAELFSSDGVIVTGTATGAPTDPEQVKEVHHHVRIPVLVGSGVTVSNVSHYMNANALIVGSHLKLHGEWFNELDPNRVKEFMNVVHKHREEEFDIKKTTSDLKDPHDGFDLTAEGE